MKQTLVTVLALVGAAALLVGAFLLWRQRPWRPAASVNGRVLTAAGLDLRARADLEDAKKFGRLMFPAAKEAEAFAHFRREHAKLWILKEVVLSEAVTRGIEVGPDDEKQEYERLERRLSKMGLKMDDYLKNGLIPEEQKRQEVRETILMRKFTDGEILPKIKVDPKEVDERFKEMQRRALVETKPGAQPKTKPSRRAALDSLREERYRVAYRDLFRRLFVQSDVKCPEYPALEDLNEISPPRTPEERQSRSQSKNNKEK